MSLRTIQFWYQFIFQGDFGFRNFIFARNIQDEFLLDGSSDGFEETAITQNATKILFPRVRV